MDLEQLKSRFTFIQGKKLTGGIVGTHLRIADNGNGELTFSGDISITIKLIDLTSTSTDRLTSLISFTQQAIANKLKGGAYASGYQYLSIVHQKTFLQIHLLATVYVTISIIQ
ncbi:hypothetical protein SAMN06265348_11050 [Pedobacter westerhofensis]|uniref:Uncharacterized protein n=1 Tax=Pedobacter westerhofensis TaxID=425512 RepID=A0A521F465_9SPHI|nr:hypothetical protein [Pedobacter westerhofensis]SMO90320.1 hypothetical protein SAMN06265348_11050 [Pedobacter westerhofensis]